VTSRGHCDGDACGQRWLFWALWGACALRGPVLWEKEEGWGGLRAPLLGISPWCHSAPPWAQGMPSTSPCVPAGPAPPHPMRGVPWMRWWQQQRGSEVLRDPPNTQLATSSCEGRSTQTSRWREGEAQPVSLDSIKELPIARCCVGPCPCPWSVESCRPSPLRRALRVGGGEGLASFGRPPWSSLSPEVPGAQRWWGFFSA